MYLIETVIPWTKVLQNCTTRCAKKLLSSPRLSSTSTQKMISMNRTWKPLLMPMKVNLTQPSKMYFDLLSRPITSSTNIKKQQIGQIKTKNLNGNSKESKTMLKKKRKNLFKNSKSIKETVKKENPNKPLKLIVSFVTMKMKSIL